MPTIYKIIFLFLFSLLATNSFAYTAHNNKIYDSNGNVINIDGVNWSGFQDSGFIDELYGNVSFYAYPAGNINFGVVDMLKHPWLNSGTGVTKANSVSFKTIRLPIQPNNLRDTKVNSHFRYDLTNAADHSQGNGVFCQTWDTRHCTAGLSVKESLYTVLNEFKKNNIKVLVDFHQTPVGRNGNVVESNYPLSSYSADVKELATQIKTRGLTNIIGIDVFNEPHNLNWFTAKGSQPSWASVIQTAGLAVYQTNPDLLIFVEGTDATARSNLHICVPLSGATTPPSEPNSYTLIQNSSACGSSKYEVVFRNNWGEAFGDLLSATEAAKGNAVFDLAQFKTAVCGSNTAFCTWLLGDPSKPGTYGHLVFSPHIYGQHVATWQSSAKASPYRFDWNWGFLQKAGFPVVIGETGFLPDQATDVAFFQDSIAPYLVSNNMNHNLLFWTWNTNSGDTGGVRKDANTIQLVALKENLLAKLYNDTSSTGTLQVRTASRSDTKCSAASDKLYVDGSALGNNFTVSSGTSQTVSTGTHAVALASSTSIPAGGSLTGYCTSTLSGSQVTIAKGLTATVNATYVYHAPAQTGIIQVKASSSSDPKCSSALDKLYLDGSTTGTAFTAGTGVSQTVATGAHTLNVASLTTIPAGGGQSGTCTSTLSAGQVTVAVGQTSPVAITYQYQAATGMSCSITSATVTQQSDWGLPSLVNTFQVAVTLKGFPADSSGKIALTGSFTMKNNFIQNFYGNFGIQSSSYSGAIGKFTGAVYSNQFTLGGFIANATPLTVGSNPLRGMTLNGVQCN